MPRVVLSLLPIAVAMAIYALVDCIQTDDERVRHLPKVGWILLIVFAVIIGPVAWLIAGRQRGPGRPRTRPSGSGPIAPDDDPEFLRRLEDEARRKRRKNREDGPAPEPPEV